MIGAGPCIACGGVTAPLLDLPHGRVEACRTPDCGLRRLVPQPDDDSLRALYDGLYYRAAGDGAAGPAKENSDAAKLAQHLAQLESLAGIRGRRILDFGCGIGNFAALAREAGAADVIGVESNPAARLIAQNRGLRVAATTGELAGELFDIVYMNDTIEHLRDPVGTCRELRARLVPGGALFVATINCAGLKARLRGARWDMYLDPTHFFFFSGTSLGRVLAAAGYERIRRLDFPVAFSHHGPLRRVLQRTLVALALDSSIKTIARAPADGTRGAAT